MIRRLLSPALLAAALLHASVAFAVPESLLRNSPFVPTGGASAAKAPQVGRIELHGIFDIDGKPRFSLLDTSTGRGAWLAVGESEGGIRVAAFDAAAEAVTVECEGQSTRLTMKAAEIINIAVPAVASAATPGANTAGVNPAPPANEQEIQERRAKIIEELRRRRALRQGGQPGGQPGGPPIPQPMPQGRSGPQPQPQP